MINGAKRVDAEPGAPDAAGSRAPNNQLDHLAQELGRLGLELGLAAVGIAPATPMEATRRILEDRKSAGLSGGMQFTYRNPARSTDPARILAGAAALVVGAWPYGPPSGKGSGRDGTDGGASGNCGEGGESGLTPAADSDLRSGRQDGSEAALRYDRPKGRVARYARRDHYEDLRKALGQLAGVLTQAGWRARVVADDNALVDRAAAQRAGLGWFGKNSNILLPGVGSWVLLGSVVTDAPLPASAPVSDGCGSCRRCLRACPTAALVAPGVLDARKCLAWLVQAAGVFPFEYRVALEGRIYGCDDCQETCPANRLVARMAPTGEGRRPAGAHEDPDLDRLVARMAPTGERRRPGGPDEESGVDPLVPRMATTGEGRRPVGVDEEADVDLLDLLGADDQTLMSRYGRWYIPERDPRYLRRNALVALGNVADGSLPEVGATLSRYLDHPDDLLRAHAVWAAFRAGRQDLLARRPHLLEDPSPVVRSELARLSEVPVRSTFTGH